MRAGSISYEKQLYQLLQSAVLACAGLFALGNYLGTGDVKGYHLPALLGALLWAAGLHFLPAKGKLLELLLTLLGLGIVFSAFGWPEGLEFGRTYVRWCLGAFVSQEEWIPFFQGMQAVLIALGAYLLEALAARVRFLRPALAASCLLGLLGCLFARVSLSHMGVVFLILFVVTVCLEEVQMRWKKVRGGSLQGLMVWMTPFLALFLILTAWMPAPAQPFAWQGARQVYSQIREAFLKLSFHPIWGRGGYFDQSFSGFSEDGKLGGGVREDTEEVMTLQGKNLLTNVYLAGNILDTFDGRQWTKKDTSGEEERFLDAMEIQAAVRRLDGDHVRDYLRMTTLRIRYEAIRTDYLFTPLKTVSVKGVDSALSYSFDGGNLVFRRRKGYGTEYELQYVQLNMGEDLFEELLESSGQALRNLEGTDLEGSDQESADQERADQEASAVPPGLNAQEWNSHRENIEQNYLDPVPLSREVREYLDEMIQNASSDLERLRAIERELGSFTYTRTPGALPEEIADAGAFLDYFLLKSRKGYCTYFATAFVLLARSIGIPARYVQGFCVPVGEEDTVTVLSDMAHSWPEVYLEGVGWIPFEPTPGYAVLRYTPWKVSSRNTPSASLEEILSGTSRAKEDADDLVREESPQEAESPEPEPVPGLRLEWIARLLLRGFLILSAGLLLFVSFCRFLSRYRYGKLSPEEKLRARIVWNCRILSWLGLKRDEQETLQEFYQRAASLSLPPLSFLEEYERVLYGGAPATAKQLAETAGQGAALMGYLKKKKRISYVFYWLRLFMMGY